MAKQNKKINLWLNGEYTCSSSMYPTCKAFVNAVKSKPYIMVASSPNPIKVVIHEDDVIKAHYDK